jgi:hypothetical protein
LFYSLVFLFVYLPLFKNFFSVLGLA